MIIFCSYLYTTPIINMLTANDYTVKDLIKWIKNNPMPRNRDRRYVQDTEYAIWAVKNGGKWTFNRPSDKPYLRAEYHYPIVPGSQRLHPTQKPVALMGDLVRVHTNPGDIVLDPFMGSGSTGVACRQLNREFIGIEKDPISWKIAKDRV